MMMNIEFLRTAAGSMLGDMTHRGLHNGGDYLEYAFKEPGRDWGADVMYEVNKTAGGKSDRAMKVNATLS